MQLTPGTTIERGDTVSRQTIYDLVNNAVGSTVQESDLDKSVLTIVTASEAPTPAPGKIWFDQTEQLAKVYVDCLDGTGVSLWTAFGPDRFDVAMIAAEPIPFGAAVVMAGDGRWAMLPPNPDDLKAMGEGYYEWEISKVVGFNQSGTYLTADTVASGAWFVCSIDGFMRTWHPGNLAGYASKGGLSCSQDSLILDPQQFTSWSGQTDMSAFRGGMTLDLNNGAITKNRGSYLIESWQQIILSPTSAQEFFYPLQRFNGPHIANHWN